MVVGDEEGAGVYITERCNVKKKYIKRRNIPDFNTYIDITTKYQ